MGIIGPDLFGGCPTHLDPLDLLHNVPLHETGQAWLRRHVDVTPPQHGEAQLLDVGAQHSGAEIKLVVAQSLTKAGSKGGEGVGEGVRRRRRGGGDEGWGGN